MNLKERFQNIKKKIQLSGIWDAAKRVIEEELNMGQIKDVLQKKEDKFYTCPKGFPSEYCSKGNIEETFLVETDTGAIIQIMQGYYGLNFEAPCDKSIFKILDANNKVLYESKEEDFQKKKKDKRGRKEKKD